MAEVPVQNKDIENKDIEIRVKKVVAETLDMKPEEITRETSFDKLDSLDRLELPLNLIDEFEEFKVEISDEEAEKIQNVGQVIELIETKTRGC